MKGNIYIIDANGSLQAMQESNYISEEKLQLLLRDYPNLLAGEQIDPEEPRQWLLVSREIGIPIEEQGSNWFSLDHLFLDQEGIPTLIEVKRSTDTRIRREVVGQMLDYAANAVAHWPANSIREHFESLCENNEEDSSQVLADFLTLDITDQTELDNYWDRVSTNLRAGRIRLVFVADEIPPPLRRVIEFLNEQMDPAQVFGLSIKQYVGGDIKTLVPSVIGKTTATKTQRRKHKWDQESFLAKLEIDFGEPEVSIARKIITWSKVNMPSDWWGEGTKMGSYIPGIDHKGQWHQTIGVWTNGYIEIQFQYMKNDPPFDREDLRLEYLNRLNQIEGVNLPPDSIDLRPSIKMNLFADEKKLDQLFELLRWFVEQVNAS